MIIKIHRAGKSFKGLVRYLTHDADRAESAQRVAWTHTRNLANDHVASAVHEMISTHRSADQIKRQAGISTSGSKLEKPVKHYSLSWHKDERPTREEMIGVAERYLKRLGIDDRQAILVCHDDKPHPHVHIVVNSVSPEDGRAIQSAFEFRRTQAFALQYEREQGLIYCEERLKATHERQKSPTRGMWEAFKPTELEHQKAEVRRVIKDFDRFIKSQPGDDTSNDWQALKVQQRHDRESFFVEGKREFKELRDAVFREVRETFRPEWREFYNAKRHGIAPELAEKRKDDILARQRAALKERSDAACAILKTERDAQYDALKKQHIEERQHLRQEQALGRHPLKPMRVRVRSVLDDPKPEPQKKKLQTRELEQAFRGARREVTKRIRKLGRPAKERDAKPMTARPRPPRARVQG